MVPTTFHLIRTLARRRRVVCHRDAVADAKLDLPRRIDGPAAAAQLAGDLRRHRCEDITPTLYLDDRHRLVGTAIVAAGWVQAPRPSTRPILHGSQARRATGFVSVRSRRWGTPNATEPEDRTLPPPRCCVQPIRARCGRSRGGGGGRQWLVRLDSASPAVSRSVAPLPVSEHPCNIITLCQPGRSLRFGITELGALPMSELSAGSIFDDVDAKISKALPDGDTRILWADIRAAFDDGGPSAVKGVIVERVRQSRLAVEKDLR